MSQPSMSETFRGRQDTPGRAAAARRLLALLVGLAACATPSATDWTDERLAEAQHLVAVLNASATPVPDGALRVRLAFGENADLDLYVTDTDPRFSETVYFAKHTTRAGGRLLRDARCSDAAPRIDAVLYEAPLASGYRIGVDHHRSCANGANSEVFVVEWASGGVRRLLPGIARPGHFDDRFWMLDSSELEAASER